MALRNNATKTRGRPFKPGNPGRPKGSRHKTTLAIEALLDGEAEALTRKAIEMALAGDTTALRLCFERLAPPRRDRPIIFELGPMSGPADALDGVVKVIHAMTKACITPDEATTIVELLERYRRSFETVALEARIEALEALQ